MTVLFLRSPLVRFATAIIGPMAAFQRTEGIDPFKMVALMAFVAAAGIALVELPLVTKSSRDLAVMLQTPTLAAAAVVALSLEQQLGIAY
ncbi:MAG: hypothetical protein R2848_15350 [Thermomicrobiales bacterium]